MRLITLPRSGVSVTGLFPAIEPSPSPASPTAGWPGGASRAVADSSLIGNQSAASRQAVAILVVIAAAGLAAWASLGSVPRLAGRRRDR
jgi:hypothetical protein